MADPIDLIERYFEDSLSAAELKDFQQRLETDEAFAQAFELEKDLMEGIEVMGNKNLKEDLKGYYKEEIEEKERPKQSKAVSRRIWLTTAAAIALLLVVSWWMNRPSHERLYAEYFQPEFDFVEKGSNNELIAQVERVLKTGDYEAALPLLETLSKQAPENADLSIAKGVAYIETGSYEKGRIVLQEVGKQNPLFQKEAAWYTGLSFLKQGKIQKAYELFQQIPGHKKAQTLSQKIKKLLD